MYGKQDQIQCISAIKKTFFNCFCEIYIYKYIYEVKKKMAMDCCQRHLSSLFCRHLKEGKKGLSWNLALKYFFFFLIYTNLF